jgi:flagella basal body P-ring formation protein FlgA
MMALILLALGVADPEVRLPATRAQHATVPLAIERAVVDRMGDVQVVVRDVSTSVVDQEGLMATIEPGARLGQPIRFILLANGKRVGAAVARLEVVAATPRARRQFARDDEIATGDIDMARAEIKNVLLQRLPELADVVGARARRDIMAGEVLTIALVAVPPAVRSGDEVRVIVTMGAVQVSGVGLASGSGQVGDMVRVRLRTGDSAGHITPSSRRLLNARIVGRGAVEISR